MALSSYTDLYKLEDYQDRVRDIRNETTMALSGEIKQRGKEQIKAQIATLRQKEKQIFDKLHITSIEQLNQRIQEYKNTVINFSGAGLYEEFIGVLQAENAEEYSDFQQAVKEVLGQEFFDQEGLQIVTEQAYQKAMLILNEGFSRQRFKSTQGFSGGKIQTGKFTQWQKKRWKQLFSSKFYNSHPKAKMYVDKHLTNTEPSIQSTSVDTSEGFETSSLITWKTGTSGLKPTEAKKIYANNPDGLQLINNKMTSFILSKVPQDQELIRTIIEHILSKEPYAFFVGDNEKDITGLLGEIAGLYYLSKLLGGFNQDVISWRGGTHTGDSNTKPHQDIILEGLGIQVKNSVEEQIKTISFAGASIETMLQKAQLPVSVKNIFLNFYGTQAFNIPYHRDGQHYIDGAPSPITDRFQIFQDWKNSLDESEDMIQRLLSLSAAFFLYMDVYSDAAGMDANTLFLLGGTTFQTAANILQTILDTIDEEERNFNIRSSYKSDRNIVSALNDNSRAPNYSQMVLDNIELKSSYDFSNLIKRANR